MVAAKRRSDQGSAGRRSWRSEGNRFWATTLRYKKPEMSGSCEDELSLRSQELELLQLEREFRLLLRAFTLGNFLAQRAWVFAVKGANHCLRKREGLQIAYKHGGPGDGLEQRPVQAHGAGQRNGH